MGRGLQPTYHTIMASPIGKLGLIIQQSCLSKIDFLFAKTPLRPPTSPIVKAIVADINAYFTNPKHKITIPLILDTTPFQQRVLKALQKIPSGETKTYGELAKTLNTSPRAIGQACRRNPIPIIIPCHRIVAQQNLGGYAGATQGHKLATKEWLLQHESSKT